MENVCVFFFSTNVNDLTGIQRGMNPTHLFLRVDSQTLTTRIISFTVRRNSCILAATRRAVAKKKKHNILKNIG